MALSKPQFVDVDPANIVIEMVADYESRTGKKLQPADIERLQINGYAYRESLVRNQINYAALQCLVDFASAPVLDYLVALVGVVRIPSVAARCLMTLEFVGNTISSVIPEGTRIAAANQKVFFRTVQDITVEANQPSANVFAECDTEGVDGNDYAIGEIRIIMDPLPYLVSAINSDVTTGGAEEESDDQLRERSKLAVSAFSTAGPKEAYKYFALSANPTIVDAAVVRLIPGTVGIYPLIDSGDPTPIEILDAVEAACNDDRVRPLTDTIEVHSPTRIDYTLDVRITIFDNAIQAEVLEKANENLAAFILAKRKKLGRDIIGTQLKNAICNDIEDEVYDLVLFGFSDIIVSDQSFAFCTASVVAVVGTNPG